MTTKNSRDSIKFKCGKTMKNRFMLAPLTNQQSNEDGSLDIAELNFLAMRAKGQFGMVMTCAVHVQEIGKGFSGQLGIFKDDLIEDHKQVSQAIQKEGALAILQLHHAGARSPENLINGQAVGPSNDTANNTRMLKTSEVEVLREDFIQAAIRAKKSGYDGVEIHGAHGYILAQFLSPSINSERKDQYGGNLQNRARLIYEIIDGIRLQCGEDFILGLRLSPERFGMKLAEIKELYRDLINTDKLDFLDISLWDCFKMPEEIEHQDKALLLHFTELPRKNTLLTVAGKIYSAKDVDELISSGVDFVGIGRAGILHHDFPKLAMHDTNFQTVTLPVSESYLKNEGLGQKFVNYMKKWDGFVK